MTVTSAGGRKGTAAGSRHQGSIPSGHKLPVQTMPPSEVRSLLRDDAGLKVVAVMGPRLLLLRQEAEITACALAAAHKTRAAGLKRKRPAVPDPDKGQAPPPAADAPAPATSSPSNTSSQTTTRPALFAIPPSLNGATLNVTAGPPTPTNIARHPLTTAPAPAGQRAKKKAKKGPGAEEPVGPAPNIPPGATLHCFPVPLQSKLGKGSLNKQHQQQRQGLRGAHKAGVAVPPGGVRVPISVVPSLVVVAAQPGAMQRPAPAGARAAAARRPGAPTPPRPKGQLARVASNKAPPLSPGSRSGSGVAVIGVPGANTPPAPTLPPAQVPLPPPPPAAPPALTPAPPLPASAQLPPRPPPAPSHRISRPSAGTGSGLVTATTTGNKRKSSGAAAQQQQQQGFGQQQGGVDAAAVSEQQRRWNLEQRKLLMGHFDSITQQDDTSPKKGSLSAETHRGAEPLPMAPPTSVPVQLMQGAGAGIVPSGPQGLPLPSWGSSGTPSYQRFQQQQAQLQLLQQQQQRQQLRLQQQQQQQLQLQQQQQMLQLQQQQQQLQQEQRQRAAALAAVAVARPAPIPSDDEDEDEEEDNTPCTTVGMQAAQAWLSKLRLTQQEFDAFKEEGLSSSAPLHEGLDVASDPLLGLSGPPRSTPTVPEVVRVRAALERCIQDGDHAHAELLLGMLSCLHLSPVLLAASQVAAAVVPLRRHLHPAISEAAQSLVRQWRDTVSASVRSGGLAVALREGGEPAHGTTTHHQGIRRTSALQGRLPNGCHPLAIPLALSPAAAAGAVPDVALIPTPGAQPPQPNTTSTTPGSAPAPAAVTAGRLTFGSWTTTQSVLGGLPQFQGGLHPTPTQHPLHPSHQPPAPSSVPRPGYHLHQCGQPPSFLVQKAGGAVHGTSLMTAVNPASTAGTGSGTGMGAGAATALDPRPSGAPLAVGSQMSDLARQVADLGGDPPGAPGPGSMTDLSVLAGNSMGPVSLFNGPEASDLRVGISVGISTPATTANATAALRDDASGGGGSTPVLAGVPVQHACVGRGSNAQHPRANNNNSAAISSSQVQSHAMWKAQGRGWAGFPAPTQAGPGPGQGAAWVTQPARQVQPLAGHNPHLPTHAGQVPSAAQLQQQQVPMRNGFYYHGQCKAETAPVLMNGTRNGQHPAAASLVGVGDLSLNILNDEDGALTGGDELLAPLHTPGTQPPAAAAAPTATGGEGGLRKRARLCGWGLGRGSPDGNMACGMDQDDDDEDLLLPGACTGHDQANSPAGAAMAAEAGMVDSLLLTPVTNPMEVMWGA